jgi:hypothetical protein
MMPAVSSDGAWEHRRGSSFTARGSVCCVRNLQLDGDGGALVRSTAVSISEWGCAGHRTNVSAGCVVLRLAWANVQRSLSLRAAFSAA